MSLPTKLFSAFLLFLSVLTYAPASEADAQEINAGNEAVLVEGEASPDQGAKSLAEILNQQLEAVNEAIFSVLFFDLSFGIFEFEHEDEKTGEFRRLTPGLPFVVVFLAAGAIFFTLLHGFINLRYFRHAVDIVKGKFSKDDDEGDVSPFRAFTSALSATVGLGNIAGVAVAMVLGGPGALFWMMFLGFFGMSSKFHESTLALIYRQKNPDGTFSGGPMFYLSRGIADHRSGLAGLGKIMAVIFAVCLMFAAVGGGNMFQANQAYEAFFTTFVLPALEGAQVEAFSTTFLFPALEEAQIDHVREWTSYGFGMTIAAAVGFVVLGGITRIGAATSRIVPVMATLYVLSCLVILAFHLGEIPRMIALVFSDAFSFQSAYGGIIGVLIVGFQRAAFSSEAGLGSSAVVHAAARTKEPVREGLVASLEPFVDTIIVCFMTGMVVLVTGAYLSGEGASAVTLKAFGETPVVGSFMRYALSLCIILFAVSTMLAWCYYGERAWGYLFGIRSIVIFRLIFVCFAFVGSVTSLGAVLDFADAALLSTAIPNILGGVILAPIVVREVRAYRARHNLNKTGS